MSDPDEWGHDPSVQRMRRVFARMEILQKDFIDRLKISPWEGRLRRSREEARNLFERMWPLAIRKGITLDEKDAAILYTHGLARTLIQNGIKVPPETLFRHAGMIKFLDEELK